MPNRNRNASSYAYPLRDRILPMLGSMTGSRSLLKAMLRRVLAHLHYGRLTIVLPDDDTLHFSGDHETDLRAAIHIHDWQAIRKLATGRRCCLRRGLYGWQLEQPGPDAFDAVCHAQ